MQGGTTQADPTERETHEQALARIQVTLSPKIQSMSRCAIVPRWTLLTDRHGQVTRHRVWHVFHKDTHADPRKRKKPQWLGKFAYRLEAEAFAQGFLSGKSQVWMGGALAGAARAYQLRKPTGPATLRSRIALTGFDKG